jgi:cytochrome c553
LAIKSRRTAIDPKRKPDAPGTLRTPLAKLLTRPALSICVGLVLATTASLPSAIAADGRDLATNGNSNGAPQCSACHGEQGEGRPDAAYPRLAGLDARYLLRQLNDFADGNRDNEIMRPIAKALSSDEREAVTSFYAGLTTPKAH